MDVGVPHRLRREVAERRLADEQLEGEDRQRIAIGRLRRRLGFEELRGHVGDGAHRDVGGTGEPSHRAGDAEVQQGDVVGGVEEDVGRLDVAVQHLLLVGVLEGIGELAHDGGGAGGPERTGGARSR